MAIKFSNGADLQNQRIINLADGSANTDAVTVQQLNNLVNGLAFKDEVRVATTANGQTVDGVTLATGDRILLKNQTTATENGIYVVPASGTPTRATDADAGFEFRQATVRVVEGTVNGNTQWTCTNTSTPTIGSTAINFASSGATAAITAGNGLTGTTTFSVLASDGSLTVAAGGVRIADAAAGNGLTLTSGVLAVGTTAGSGITVAADAVSIDTTVVPRKFTSAVGGSTTVTVNHLLATQDVVVSVREVATNGGVVADWVAIDANNVTITFATAPAAGAYRVTVIG